MNPIQYLDDTKWVDRQDAMFAGYKGPGWYHWSETWTEVYGPYESKEIASEKCKEYARQL